MADFSAYADFVLKARKESGGQIFLGIAGTSMLPLIRQGDRVVIRPVDAEWIRLGDVFAFWENGRVVVHRCVGKRRIQGKWRICQKGDNLVGWSWLPGDRVVGTVERIVKPDRALNLSDKTWTWFNGTMGFLMSHWILLVEKMMSFDADDRVRGSVPMVSTITRKTSRAVHCLCLLSLKVKIATK